MTDRYVNLSGSYATGQAGTSGDPYQGPYGAQKAFDLTDNNDIAYFTGTADLRRLVSLTIGSALGYGAGDEVRNYTGSGDNWTGYVCEVAGSVILVELDIGYTWDDIDTADGIENTTDATNTSISDKGTRPAGLQLDTQVGAVPSGSNLNIMQFIGTDTSWNRTWTDRAIFDCGSSGTKALNALRLQDSVQFYAQFMHMECKNAYSHGLDHYGADYLQFVNCRFNDNGGSGIGYTGSKYLSYASFILCQANNNTGNGFEGYSNVVIALSEAAGNGGYGFVVFGGNGASVFNCIFSDNTTVGCGGFSSGYSVVNNIIDRNGIGIECNSHIGLLIGNRITYNTTGYSTSSSTVRWTNWLMNYFVGNTANFGSYPGGCFHVGYRGIPTYNTFYDGIVSGIAPSDGDYNLTQSSGDGYIDDPDNYNLAESANMRRIPIVVGG